MLVCFFHLSTTQQLNGIHDPGLEGEMLWRVALGQMRQLEYGLHSGCSLFLSLSLNTHTHTPPETSAKSWAHMCKCILEMCNHKEEFNRCQGLTLFNWAANHGIVFIHTTHTHTHPASSSFVLQRVVQPWSKWSQENFQPVLRWLHVSLLDAGTLAQACRLAPVISSLRFLCIQQHWRGQGGPLSRV